MIKLLSKLLEASRGAHESERPQIDRRISELEKRIEIGLATVERSIAQFAHNRSESYLKAFAIVFAVLIGAFGFLSWSFKSDAEKKIQDAKAEAQEAIKENEGEIQLAISNMNSRFQALAGEALAKPDLRILMESGQPLNGHIFEWTNGAYPPPGFPGLFFENVGKKKTDDLVMTLYCSNVAAVRGQWMPKPTPPNKEFAQRLERGVKKRLHSDVRSWRWFNKCFWNASGLFFGVA